MCVARNSFGKLAAILGIIICVCGLSGCVAGQSIKLAYLPDGNAKISSTNKITVEVLDERPFIKTGEKAPSYIGHYRGGYGNTWDVTTEGNVSLAELFKNDLVGELNSLGFETKQLSGDRILKISIQEYNFDAYLNGKIWYKINAKVFDANNKILADDMISDTVAVKGSVWVGAKYAFEREMPKIYQSIISGIVRENDKIMLALK